MTRWFAAAGGMAALLYTASAGAQDLRAGAAAETVISIRAVSDGRGGVQPAIVVDAAGGLELRGVTFIVRPMLFRSGGRWTGVMYQAVARVQGRAPVAWRVDAGYLAPVMGLASADSRADVNPTVLTPYAYPATVPPFEAGVPRVRLLAPSYPLGVEAAASGSWWDTRAAISDSSPARASGLLMDGSPARAVQWTMGGGVSPLAGLRVGAAWSQGAYAQASETSDRRSRQATLQNVEVDWSGGYGRVYGEWLRGSFARYDADRAVAQAVWITAVRTLSPRWFAAARGRYMSSPSMPASTGSSPDYADDDDETGYHEGGLYAGDGAHTEAASPAASSAMVAAGPEQYGAEATVGFRVTPAITVRAGYVGLRPADAVAWRHRAGASVTWSQRW